MGKRQLPPPDVHTVTVYNEAGRAVIEVTVRDPESARAVAAKYEGKTVEITKGRN